MASNNIFAFKPEVEVDIIIDHPDIPISILYRQMIFKNKYHRKIKMAKEEPERKWDKLTKKRKIDAETCEEFIKNLKLSKEGNWLNEKEEVDIAIEEYISEIRMEHEKETRTKKWVKDHFFELLIFELLIFWTILFNLFNML